MRINGDKKMQISHDTALGAVLTVALGIGIYKGYCKGNGIDISFGMEVGTSYGMPIIGTIVGASGSDFPGISGLGEIVNGAIGGVGCFVCQGVGMGIGYFVYTKGKKMKDLLGITG